MTHAKGEIGWGNKRMDGEETRGRMDRGFKGKLGKEWTGREIGWGNKGMDGEETRGEWMEVLRVSWVKNGH